MPEAWQLPRMPVTPPSRQIASTSSGEKAFSLAREITPVEHDGRAGDLPVPRWRILALGNLVRRAVQAEDAIRHRHAGRIVAARQLGDFEQAQCRHVRQAERPLAQSGPVAETAGAELRDMAKRVGAEIAVFFRVAGRHRRRRNQERTGRHVPSVTRQLICQTAGMADVMPAGFRISYNRAGNLAKGERCFARFSNWCR